MSARLSDFNRETGAKYGCAFCGSELSRRPCGFHEGVMARLLVRRQIGLFLAAFVLAAGLTIAALILGETP